MSEITIVLLHLGIAMAATQHNSVWESTFSHDEQRELKSEDSEAWNGVTALLIFIVSMGVLIGATGVMLAYYFT
jgi:hypothetical protein